MASEDPSSAKQTRPVLPELPGLVREVKVVSPAASWGKRALSKHSQAYIITNGPECSGRKSRTLAENTAGGLGLD